MPSPTLNITLSTDISFDSVTPGQGNSRIELDVPETVCIDAGVGKFRKASEITILSNTGSDTAYSQRVRRWSTSCITLAVVQESFSYTYEQFLTNVQANDIVYGYDSTPASRRLKLIGLAANQAIDLKLWAYPNGVGFVHPPELPLTGDPLLRRIVKADASWVSGVSISPQPPQQSGEAGIIAGTPLFGTANVPLDCIGYSENNDPADQGYFLRWLAPGLPMSSPDVVFNFYFGQYCVIFGGNGEAILAEYCQAKGGGAYRWRRRTAFRYCQLGNAIGFPHTMTIFPHKGPNGEKYIAFAGSTLETTAVPNFFFDSPPVPREFVYEATDIHRGGDPDASPGNVTKSAPCRIDCRRDIRCSFHFSQMLFWREGVMRDAAFSMPDFATRTEGAYGYVPNPFRVKFRAELPKDFQGNAPSINFLVRDVNTLDTSAVRHPAVEITLQGADYGPVIDNNSASFKSPILWGYGLVRDAQLDTSKPGKFTLPAQVVALQDHTGPNVESIVGEVTAHSLIGENVEKLLNRSRYAARVLMDYQESPGAPIKKIVLARGAVSRPEIKKRGKIGSSFPDHYEISFLMSGMRDRLQAVTARAIDFESFSVDEAAPVDPLTGSKPPWKVTDVIRFMLKSRGFLDAQVLIPDLPSRLWSGSAGFKEDSIYTVYTDVLSQCQSLCRNYLGAYIIWDVNAGPLESVYTGDSADDAPTGAWRVLQPPPANSPVVYNFVTGPVFQGDGTTFIPPHSPAAYPPNTTFIMDPFIAKPLAPEFNHLWVFTSPPIGGDEWMIETHLFNPKSYKVPGMTTPPDPMSAHYIGHESMYILPDMTLVVPGDNGNADKGKTRAAVNWVARRIFDFAGKGRKIYPFTAPLVLVTDTETGRKRPLRYYDKVTVNGETGWYVRSVSIHYKSFNHLADYELEKTIPI